MASVVQAKTLGGVGSILVLLLFVPTVGFILAIVGFILMLIAVKYISDALKDSSIFSNILIAIVLAIVGVAIGGVVVLGSVFRFVGLGGFAGFTPGNTPVPSNVFGLIGGIIAGLVVVWIMLIIAAYFQRKSYYVIAARLDVGMFRTAALVFLIGAALTIVLIGFLFLVIAQILFIVAFFSIRENMVSTSPGSMLPPSSSIPTSGTSPQAGRFCVKCGASLPTGSSFCPSCGASQPT